VEEFLAIIVVLMFWFRWKMIFKELI